MEKEPSPIKYVEQHLESEYIAPETLATIMERLEKPLDNLTYKGEGNIKAVAQPLSVEFSYRKLLPEDQEGKNFATTTLMLESEEWRILNNSILRDKEKTPPLIWMKNWKVMQFFSARCNRQGKEQRQPGKQISHY